MPLSLFGAIGGPLSNDNFIPRVRHGRRNDGPGPMGKARPSNLCLPSYEPVLLSEIFEKFRLHLGDRQS